MEHKVNPSVCSLFASGAQPKEENQNKEKILRKLRTEKTGLEIELEHFRKET